MATVRAMTITADSLLPRPKCNYDGDYDVDVKGLIVVVMVQVEVWLFFGGGILMLQ
jgi:hypothetical protein